PGHRAPGQRRDVDDSSGCLRGHRRLRAFEHQSGIRAARADLRQPELSPPTPQVGRTPGRQPRLRPDDLAPAVPPSGVSDGRRDRAMHDRRQRGGAMTTTPQLAHAPRARTWLAALVKTRKADLPVDLALVAVRTALAWIFIWYGSGKLFGSFNGPGIHVTSLF